jgi:hypothetical protein
MSGLANWTTHIHHCKYVTHGQLKLKEIYYKSRHTNDFKIYKDGNNSNAVEHKFVRLMGCAQLHSIHTLKEYHFCY